MTTPYRIRSVTIWDLAREEYLGGMTAEDICRRHDLGLAAFRRRARRHGWRRIDVAPQIAGAMDLLIYEDFTLHDQADIARNRFLQALNEGRALEARRWKDLLNQLVRERNNIDSYQRPKMTPQALAEIQDAIDDEEDEHDRREAEEADAEADAEAADEGADTDEAPENVHYVHSKFSSGHFGDLSLVPPGSAYNVSASTRPVAAPPDTTDPPATA